MKREEAEAAAQAEAGDTAAMVLDIFSGFGVMLAGPEAAMKREQRELIEAPLRRQIAKYNLMGRAAALADPLAILVGFATWGAQVFELRQSKMKDATPQQTAPEQSAQVATAAEPAPTQVAYPPETYDHGTPLPEVITKNMQGLDRVRGWNE